MLGDPGFPLSDVLIPTFDHRGGAPTNDQKAFNTRHCRARDVVERMFGHVKGRFRILLNKIEIKDVRLIVLVITSCFLLHNYCLRNGEPCPAQWVQDAQQEAQRQNLQQPGSSAAGASNDGNGEPPNLRSAGVAVRNKMLDLHLQFPFVSNNA